MTKPKEGVVYRVKGRRQKLTSRGEPAPTPDGKPQAYWFIDIDQHTHHAFIMAAVKEVKKRR